MKFSIQQEGDVGHTINVDQNPLTENPGPGICDGHTGDSLSELEVITTCRSRLTIHF